MKGSINMNKPRWTPQDISDVRSSIRLFDLPKGAYMFRDKMTHRPTVIYALKDGTKRAVSTAEKTFPRLKYDVTVSLDEILNSKPEHKRSSEQ